MLAFLKRMLLQSKPVDTQSSESTLKNNKKEYKDIWALLHFKLSAMQKAGRTEIKLDDLLNKMRKLEGKTLN